MNPLLQLGTYGQSFWYDNIRRRLLYDGTIQGLIDHDGLRGMTSNPTIFDNAIGRSDDYDEQIAELVAGGLEVQPIYEALAVYDIRRACDMFRVIYDDTSGKDGYVSLEVSPVLARQTEATVSEARRLFRLVDRPNVMIKVPATQEGIPAIRQLIGEGINVNITLMFSMAHYEAVAQAYLDGLKNLVELGSDPGRIGSVASFFVSRVDTAVDALLENCDEEGRTLMGRVAVANSKLVYRRYKEIFESAPFESLRRSGAPVQRLLWASTSTKNPEYPDTLYVDELIGPDTVNTMPPSTIDAFRDHGKAAPTLAQGLEEAETVIGRLGDFGIEMDRVTESLQQDGVRAFAESFEKLMITLSEKSRAMNRVG
jgi:transaldolase